jgi:hypothetical protein
MARSLVHLQAGEAGERPGRRQGSRHAADLAHRAQRSKPRAGVGGREAWHRGSRLGGWGRGNGRGAGGSAA